MIGRQVRCPLCSGQFDLTGPPDQADAPEPNAAAPPSSIQAGAGPDATEATAAGPHRFQFVCTRCESLLEAQTDQTGQPGKCPTCATEFVIPRFYPDRGTTGDLKILGGAKQDPTPVHAYAASGHSAPQIVRNASGDQVVKCPRCGNLSPVQAHRCAKCGLPFTLEGIGYDAPLGGRNGYAVASFVMGLLGVPCTVLIVPQLLAVVFGVVALHQISSSEAQRGAGLAWAGTALGGLSLIMATVAFVARV